MASFYNTVGYWQVRMDLTESWTDVSANQSQASISVYLRRTVGSAYGGLDVFTNINSVRTQTESMSYNINTNYTQLVGSSLVITHNNEGQANATGYAWIDTGQGVLDVSGTINLTSLAQAPTVYSYDPTSVSLTSATASGEVSWGGNSVIYNRGVCYSTSANPDVNSGRIDTGGTTGYLSASITGLSPNTTYHYRIFATNSIGVSYGANKTFTTLQEPAVTSNAVSNVAVTTATMNGNLTVAGNPNVTEKGFAFGTSANPTTANTKYIVSGVTTGAYSYNLTGLSAYTTYNYRAYTISSLGTYYGVNREILTYRVPAVTTSSATDVHSTYATFNGNLTDAGYPTITEKGFVYALTSNPTTANSKKIVSGTSTGAFTGDVTGLTQSRTYYIRSYAINATGTVYGSQVTILTNAISGFSGTIRIGGVVTRKKIAKREAKGGIVIGGRAFFIKRIPNTVIEKKTYIWKVYDEEGTFLDVLEPVIDEPKWSEAINTTGSTTSVKLALTADYINSPTNTTILHNNRVDCYAFYGSFGPIQDSWGEDILDSDGDTIIGTVGAPNGIRKFSGFISEINTNYGDQECTTLQLMSFGYDLDQYPLNDEGATTVTYSGTDPAEMIRSGIAQFKVDGTGEFIYTDATWSTVQSTNTSSTYTFRVNTYRELLETAIKLAPAGWSYHVDLGLNLIYFQAKPTEANHTFYLGKHIKNFNLRSYIGDVVNDVLFTGGIPDGDTENLFVRMRVATVDKSPRVRRGLKRMSDGRVTVQDTAETIGASLIAEKNLVQYRSTVEILDKAYDIESINIGDLVAFKNFGGLVDTVTMQVVGKNYSPDVVTLQLDTAPRDVNKLLDDLNKSLLVTDNTSTGTTPVEITL